VFLLMILACTSDMYCHECMAGIVDASFPFLTAPPALLLSRGSATFCMCVSVFQRVFLGNRGEPLRLVNLQLEVGLFVNELGARRCYT
jgi:hypothetical protein